MLNLNVISDEVKLHRTKWYIIMFKDRGNENLIYKRRMDFSFVHERYIISIYPIVDLYGGIARSLQVIVDKLGERAHLVVFSI